jgi:glycosyltransferase involved in cell wall biosynthesis
MSLAFSYLVPVHNEEGGLPSLVERLRERLVQYPGSEIVLCENGSSDGSVAVGRRLAEEPSPVPVRALTTTNAGLGHGLAMGVQDVFDLHGADAQERWIVFTAADLPFDFSDLSEFLDWRSGHTEEAVLIGSKTHPRTARRREYKRLLASHAFWGLRAAILGMKTGDPQGTYFIPLRVASRLLPRIRARNYFFTTELAYWAEQSGIPIVEVPVVFAAERRKSTVRVLKHGRQMALQTLELRWRSLTSERTR